MARFNDNYPIRQRGWVTVVIYRYPSKTEPLIVNTYWHHDKKEAEAHKRSIVRDAKNKDVNHRLTVRVRQLWEPDDAD